MKNIALKYLGIGFLLQIAFNIVLFSLAMLFGFGETDSQGPTLIPALVFAIIMGAIVYGLLRLVKPRSRKEAFSYSLSWSGIVLLLTFVITAANDTTGLFFGRWFNSLSFIAMTAAPLIPGSTSRRKNN